MNKNKRMKNIEEFNENYNEKIIQDLKYTNSLLNNRNISLEKELDFLKNKYNLCKQDLNEINKHISICKENQDKIINDLKGNEQLEKLNSSNNNINPEINKKNSDKLHLFLEKMKILFNDKTYEDINDEEYLDILGNTIIKMNQDFLLCRNELNKKIHENNKLKHEIQNMKLKSININSNTNYNIPNTRVKTPIGQYKEKMKYLNNIKSNSPRSIRNKDNNNNIQMPKTPQLNIKDYINNNKDIKHINRKNNTINLDRKLINSQSYSSFKFKTLKESEKEEKYFNSNTNLNDNVNQNSNDIIQTLMNNIKHLENTFNNRPNQSNNIYSK
jgi:hypothetical protein